MANTIKLKNSQVAGGIPTTSDLVLGEIGINTHDGKVYIKKQNGSEVSIIDITNVNHPLVEIAVPSTAVLTDTQNIQRTAQRLLIQNNVAVLPSTAIGDLVWNMAIIFNDTQSTVIEAEVTATTDGTNVLFDSSDELNGKYCTVTYLSANE